MVEKRAPGAHGEVPDFGISFFSPRKPHGHTGSLESGKRIKFFNFTEIFHLGVFPGGFRVCYIHPKSVQDRQNHRFVFYCHTISLAKIPPSLSPRQESNLHMRLRRASFCPLNYEGEERKKIIPLKRIFRKRKRR